MNELDLTCLQFHFSENKGSGKGTATLDVILLNKEELLGDVRLMHAQICVLLPIPTVSKEREVRSLRLRLFKREEKPMKMKIILQSHKLSLHSKGHNTKKKKSNKNRPRDAISQTGEAVGKSSKSRRRLSLEQDGRHSQTCLPLKKPCHVE